LAEPAPAGAALPGNGEHSAAGASHRCAGCGKCLVLNIHPLEYALTAMACVSFVALFAADFYLDPFSRKLALALSFLLVLVGVLAYKTATRRWPRYRAGPERARDV
jgi:hypothetical protein